MSFSDAIGRISQIQQQLADLSLGSAAGTSSTQTTDAATTSDGTAASDFAGALTQAQGTDAAATQSVESSDIAGGASLMGTTGVTAATPLPPGASSMLTADQQQFASTLAGQTGLSPSVISAWLLAEESGSAARSRQSQNNNDWLNIGYTGSGTYGGADGIWSDPVTAATATAEWLKGQDAIPGYGTASAGVQGILDTVGQSPVAQIAALQSSGWAGSGYPNLPALYAQVTAA